MTREYSGQCHCRVEVATRKVGGRKNEDHERDAVAIGSSRVGRVTTHQLKEHETQEFGKKRSNKFAVKQHGACRGTVVVRVLSKGGILMC